MTRAIDNRTADGPAGPSIVGLTAPADGAVTVTSNAVEPVEHLAQVVVGATEAVLGGAHTIRTDETATVRRVVAVLAELQTARADRRDRLGAPADGQP